METKMLRNITLAASLLFAATGPALAQSYPNKPVKLVVPFSPGGGTDIVGRLIAQKLSETWNQTVIVDNKPGANTLIGTEYVAKAPGDGYTLLMASPSHTINPSLYKNIKFDTQKEFSGAAIVASGPLVLVANPSLAAKNVRELIALAKAKPGQISYASAGTGSSPHLAGELFVNLAGVNMMHVPYKGTAPATADLIGGQVHASFSPLPGVLQYIRNGKLKALGLTGTKRFAAMPDLPTIAESGVPGYEVQQWWGIVAPNGTPKEILRKINADVAKILESQSVREQLATMGAEPGTGSPEQFDALIRNEIVQWGKLIESAKVTAD
jgi:tripartite-type tricarboxylate transporter receptor subunit TctC